MPYLQKIKSNYILVSFFLEILCSYNIYVKIVAPIIKAGHESRFEHEKIKKQITATLLLCLGSPHKPGTVWDTCGIGEIRYIRYIQSQYCGIHDFMMTPNCKISAHNFYFLLVFIWIYMNR